MAGVFAGLRVLDLSWGVAGPVTTMLLSDYGAEVIKVEPPGGDPFRSYPGYLVWNRGKQSVVLDLKQPQEREQFERLVGMADILVESFRPGVTERLGIDYDRLHEQNPRLIYCSITGYGRHSRASARPAYDGLVQARSGMQNEQPAHRPGPVFLYIPLPSMGAMLLASCALGAALHAREITGRGQWVETSLMQGAISFLSMLWFRAEREAPEVFAGGHGPFKYKYLPGTPSYEAADGKWLKVMQGIELAARAVGEDPLSLLRPERALRSVEDRAAYYQDVRALIKRMPRDFWLKTLREARQMAFLTRPVEEAFADPQVIANGAVTEVEVSGAGKVKQFGQAWRLERCEWRVQGPPPDVGQHTEQVLRSLPEPASALPTTNGRTPAHPLSGVRVLDLGHPFAGPWGPMLLSDLGADVLQIEPLGLDRAVNARAAQAGAGTGGPGLDIVWLGCERGKRSLSLDMDTPAGQEVLRKLIATADVIHSNRGRGVARRLGFDYETVKQINPQLIYCHTTAYGETGPDAGKPGADQLAEGQCGLEWEQGAMPAGGEAPDWYRFGMCDHGNGYQSAIAVLQALYHRDKTGEGQFVDTSIFSNGMLYASDAFIAPPGVKTRPHMTRDQTGLAPLYRLYETRQGWVFVVAATERHWQALCRALGLQRLPGDPRFATSAEREQHANELAALLEPAFCTRTALEWRSLLDDAGVPCEVSEEGYAQGYGFFDDPEAIANGWVVRYQHATMGLIEQPGQFFSLSETPATIQGAPPLRGQHSREVLLELGYSEAQVRELHERGVISWPSIHVETGGAR